MIGAAKPAQIESPELRWSRTRSVDDEIELNRLRAAYARTGDPLTAYAIHIAGGGEIRAYDDVTLFKILANLGGTK